MLGRIAMLLDHNGFRDSRVARHAMMLKSAGYNIRIFCLNSDGQAKDHTLNTIKYVQCFLDMENTVPILSKLARKLRGCHTDANAMDHSQTNDSATKTHLPSQTRSKLKRALGSFFSFSNTYKAIAASVKDFKPNFIHAHDLNMLPAGGRLAKELDCKLIYDSHEYERSRNTDISRVEHSIRMWHEKLAIMQADIIITVSDSIANALEKHYAINRPCVILNTPLALSRNASLKTLMRSDFGLPQDVKIGIYVGNMSLGRGLEQAIESLTFNSDLHFAILGDTTPQRLDEIKAIAKYHGVLHQCHILESVEDTNILPILQLCDFSWIPIQKTCQSYDFALPNKLFQSFDAGLPIFATPLREISLFIEHFNCGYLARGFTAQDQAKSLTMFLAEIVDLQNSFQNISDYDLYNDKAMKYRLLQIYESLRNGSANKLTSTPFPHFKEQNEVDA